MKNAWLFFLFLFFPFLSLQGQNSPKVYVGADLLFTDEYAHLLEEKNIGLITNHTAFNSNMNSTLELLKSQSKRYHYTLKAIFAPEHGIHGAVYANDLVDHETDKDNIPIYSLHGKTQRPTAQMLQQIDLLIFDIQDIGSRSYTYISTLFYIMEEAGKLHIPLIVLDRPNPINGLTIDGPMLEEKWRSIVGYVNVPYCHGMTIGELAQFFNGEYKAGCELTVVPMKGWKRWMSFQDTGLAWIPTSPNIPESTTAFYYPTTGILGELQIVNIGIGYTLPFKLIGAPWINAQQFSAKLNAQKFPGVYFKPFYYRPFYGRFAHEDCEGILILITDRIKYRPVSTQYLIIGMLKSLYPEKFQEAIESAKPRKEMFCKVNGTEEIYRIMTEEKNIVWKLRSFHLKERENFLKLRNKYLINLYSYE